MRRTSNRPTRGPASSGRSRTTPGAAPRRGGSGDTRTTAPRSRARPTAPPVGGSHRPGPATFRRRRLVALTIMVALVVGIGFGVRAAVGAIAAADDVLPRIDSSVIPHETGGGSGPPSESELANPVECVPEAVDVALSLRSETVRKGAKTTVPVTLTNTGRVPCLLDVGKAELVLTVHSGDDLIWSSQHCGAATERRILLDIGAEDRTSFTWPGTRSAADCPAKPKTAKPGTYRVVATLWTAGESAEVIATTEETFTVK